FLTWAKFVKATLRNSKFLKVAFTAFRGQGCRWGLVEIWGEQLRARRPLGPSRGRFGAFAFRSGGEGSVVARPEIVTAEAGRTREGRATAGAGAAGGEDRRRHPPDASRPHLRLPGPREAARDRRPGLPGARPVR